MDARLVGAPEDLGAECLGVAADRGFEVPDEPTAAGDHTRIRTQGDGEHGGRGPARRAEPYERLQREIPWRRGSGLRKPSQELRFERRLGDSRDLAKRTQLGGCRHGAHGKDIAAHELDPRLGRADVVAEELLDEP